MESNLYMSFGPRDDDYQIGTPRPFFLLAKKSLISAQRSFPWLPYPHPFPGSILIGRLVIARQVCPNQLKGLAAHWLLQ